MEKKKKPACLCLLRVQLFLVFHGLFEPRGDARETWEGRAIKYVGDYTDLHRLFVCLWFYVHVDPRWALYASAALQVLLILPAVSE